jgi:hypothetical protein
VEVVGDFFRALPEVGRMLWGFIGGLMGVAIIVGSVVLTAGLAFLAKLLRDTHGWLSAIFGMMAATIAAWWAFGIIPSAWIYFADEAQDLLQGVVIPQALGIGPYIMAANFYEVFRDSVVMIETFVAMALFTVIALRIQARFPRALAEGEEARPQSGGYK